MKRRVGDFFAVHLRLLLEILLDKTDQVKSRNLVHSWLLPRRFSISEINSEEEPNCKKTPLMGFFQAIN